MKVTIIKFVILFITSEVCSESDEKYIVKINKKYSTSVGQKLQPEDFPDINKVTELEFIAAEDLKVPTNLSISNFFELNSLIVENQLLENVPILTNLTIGKLSLGYNKFKKISNTTFNNVSLYDTLFFPSNQISSIDNNTFPATDGIILNCNNLTTFKSTWFREPSKLRFIYVRNNKIKTLDKDSFKGLKNMFYLMLSSNQIQHLPDGIFNFTNLHTLDLENNQLYEIQSSWFLPPKLHITRLKLSFNRLSYIKDDFLQKVTIHYAFFSGNPWQCPCLDLIKKWMLDAKIYSWVLDEYKDVLPVCIYANSFKNICIPHIEKELYETYIMGTDVPFKKQICHELF